MMLITMIMVVIVTVTKGNIDKMNNDNNDKTNNITAVEMFTIIITITKPTAHL